MLTLTRWIFREKWFKCAFCIVVSLLPHSNNLFLFIVCVIPSSDYHYYCIQNVRVCFFRFHFFRGIKMLFRLKKSGILFKRSFDGKKSGDISETVPQKYWWRQERTQVDHFILYTCSIAHITRAYTKSTLKFIWDQTRPIWPLTKIQCIHKQPHTRAQRPIHSHISRFICKSSEYCRMNFHKSYKILM